jgi:hypothetical protein
MDGFGFLDEFSKFHEDIVTRTSIYTHFFKWS